MDMLEPHDEDGVLEVVKAALESGRPIEIVGHGSKRGWGHDVEAAAQLKTGGLTGITLYEPTELVLTARAGTPLADIVQQLDENDQELAFEPMNPTKLWPGNSTGTIGGMIAINAGGPRRIKAGAARDHILGFRAVSGRGEIFKSGGRVMKNVTGYDLSKLMTGSHGTLAVMTEITLKVLPKPETERTFVLYKLDEARACAALREATTLAYETSSFACLPDGAWAGMAPGCCLALRLEGPSISVDTRFDDLVAHFGPRGNVDDLGERASRLFWAAVRDAEPLADETGPIWKVSTAPSEGALFVANLRKAGVPLTRWYYDWAGGLVWLAVDALGAGADAHGPQIRNILERHGGHATLIRDSAETKAQVPIFHPQPAALAALSRRVKDAFDPAHIFNRGRLGLES